MSSRSEPVMLRFLADYCGPIALFVFGVALWVYGASENLFTFAAWGTLDILAGASMYKAGARKESVLPLAYGIVCAFVVMMIWKNGQWQWTTVETICATGTAIAVLCWLRFGAVAAVIVFTLALFIASVPIIISTYHNPQPWEWWLWVAVLVSATAGLYLARPWTLGNIAEWIFVATSIIVGTVLLVLHLRLVL